MIAPHLSVTAHGPTVGNQPPQDTPRLMVVLIAILAFVNVSATVLMLGSWASTINAIVELERSIPDHLAESTH
jgi:hypothetical protein